MTNPVTKWEMLDFAEEFDVGKLMENFFNLRSFGTFGVVHVHHIQTITVDVSSQASGFTAYTGLTWPEAFATGVTPRVLITPNSTNASKPAASELLTYVAYNVSRTGCSVGVHNHSVSAVGSGTFIVVTAFDPDYNTSGV